MNRSAEIYYFRLRHFIKVILCPDILILISVAVAYFLMRFNVEDVFIITQGLSVRRQSHEFSFLIIAESRFFCRVLIDDPKAYVGCFYAPDLMYMIRLADKEGYCIIVVPAGINDQDIGPFKGG